MRRQKKTEVPLREWIIVGLIDHNDQNRVNKHQQKIGNGFASFFGNKPDSYADDANDKDNQHFYQLIKN